MFEFLTKISLSLSEQNLQEKIVKKKCAPDSPAVTLFFGHLKKNIEIKI